MENITAIGAGDITITKEGDEVVLSAEYSAKVPLFGNLSACMDFEPDLEVGRGRPDASGSMDSEAFALAIGHRFAQPELLRRALTHRSHGASNNERLEFLGDSVVNCAVALELYHKFPQLTEGELSRLRANLVNQQSLAAVARRFDFGAQLLLGEGELKSGGARRPSMLADAVEAVIGAAFLDGGFEAARRVVRTLLGRGDRRDRPRDLRARTPRRCCRSTCRAAGWRCRSTRWSRRAAKRTSSCSRSSA